MVVLLLCLLVVVWLFVFVFVVWFCWFLWCGCGLDLVFQVLLGLLLFGLVICVMVALFNSVVVFYSLRLVEWFGYDCLLFGGDLLLLVGSGCWVVLLVVYAVTFVTVKVV